MSYVFKAFWFTGKAAILQVTTKKWSGNSEISSDNVYGGQRIWECIHRECVRVSSADDRCANHLRFDRTCRNCVVRQQQCSLSVCVRACSRSFAMGTREMRCCCCPSPCGMCTQNLPIHVKSILNEGRIDCANGRKKLLFAICLSSAQCWLSLVRAHV